MGYVKIPLEGASSDNIGNITLNCTDAYSVKLEGIEIVIRTSLAGAAAGQVIGWAIRFTGSPSEQDALNLEKLIAEASQKVNDILLFEPTTNILVRSGGIQPSATIADE